MGKREGEGPSVLVKSFSNSAKGLLYISRGRESSRCQLSALLQWVGDVREDEVALVVPATVRGVRGRGRGEMELEEAKG